MTDRINLTELRAEREAWKATGIPCQECAADADHVLALIDAVQAAQEFANEGFDNGVPGDPADKLHQALNRFDHT